MGKILTAGLTASVGALIGYAVKKNNIFDEVYKGKGVFDFGKLSENIKTTTTKYVEAIEKNGNLSKFTTRKNEEENKFEEKDKENKE